METETLEQFQTKPTSDFKKLVVQIYSEENTPTFYKGTVESMLREFFCKTSKRRYTWKRKTFKALLLHLYDQKCYGLLRQYYYVEALHNIASFGNRLVRPVESWTHDCMGEEEQLKSLVRHCFAAYPTPGFLELAFKGNQKKHMLWYVQLGGGRSVKQLSQLPVSLTTKMAHAFRNAPDFVGVNGALRYAQAIGFGASTHVAKMIAMTRITLLRPQEEAFWTTVVQFLAKQEDLHVGRVDEMLDYIAFRYREDNAFSMKNRSMSALWQATQQWHRERYLEERDRVFSWDASGVPSLYVEEMEADTKVVYRTVELLDSESLYEEGFAMQHCVGDYADDCHDGHATIFSLQKQVEGQPPTRMATVELRLPEGEVVQAKAKCNRTPDQKAQELLTLWMKQAQLGGKHTQVFMRPQQHAVEAMGYQHQGDDHGDWEMAVRVGIWIVYFIFRYLLAN